MLEEVAFYGHRNVRALHRGTLELTKDGHLTLRGDCIVGVRADKACSDLNATIGDRIREEGREIMFTIVVRGMEWSFTARGCSRLTLEDDRSLVIRKSRFVCPRTLAIMSSASAADMPREMVGMLMDESTRGLMIISC
ncbi:MAG: DUF371 domain-containing protein [Candidatus Nitrosocaldus sp.]|nr:DUF371 domain-containing protein [Candidatus Nitrosocaldus sp.]MDW8000044.1 DUF371 domain-containing protein [Candidatus Nitrosocaldus sp.]